MEAQRTDLAVIPTQGGAVVRSEFGAQEMSIQAETASKAVAARAQAETQARFIVARQNPRDMDVVRTKILKDCDRPGFAASARYRKPVGEGIEGPSIRFVEATLRHMGNITTPTMTIYDDPQKRIVRVSATDLESNLTYEKDVVIEKTVERNSVRDNQSIIRSRTNSKGKTVYIISATEDDLLNKEAALVSKAVRTLGLRLIPGDITDEAQARCIRTMKQEDAKDPDEARKRMVDAFAGVGVMPDQLKVYLGHDLMHLSTDELAELRAIHASIKDGEATWAEALAHKRGDSKETTSGSRAESAKAKVKEMAAKSREPGTTES